MSQHTRTDLLEMFRGFLHLRLMLSIERDGLPYFCCPVCASSWFKTPNTTNPDVIKCSMCKWEGPRVEGQTERFFK